VAKINPAVSGRVRTRFGAFASSDGIVEGQHVRLRIQLPLLVVASLFPNPVVAQDQCSAECTHPTKACICAIDGRGVSHTPIGGVDRQPAQLRQALNPGDEITSLDENAIVGLTCPGQSDVKLHGRFRAVIMPPAQGQDCALNLLAGNADVLTNNPTQVSSGETVMGSKRTMYSMRISRDSTVECAVFEGEVAVQNLKTGATRPLAANVKASWRSGQLLQFGIPVAPADITQTTRVYARADMARARAQGVNIEDPASFQLALQSRYAAVLATPNDPNALLDLAALQTIARISMPALYHLERAERLNPSRADQRASLAATKSVVYRQMGRERDAAVESEKLRTLDPARHAAIQRIDPKVQRVGRGAYDPSVMKVPPAPPIITAVATPPIVGTGEATTIAVTVKTQDGRSIGGAKVILSAGGGTFSRAAQARIEGSTDANGVFRTEWLCRPCAAAYRIDVEVTAPQLPLGRTTVDIKTR
jgi:hypothetical protein